jgi:hypothetical protein
LGCSVGQNLSTSLEFYEKKVSKPSSDNKYEK